MAQIQSLTENANRVIKAVDPDQVHASSWQRADFQPGDRREFGQYQGSGARRRRARRAISTIPRIAWIRRLSTSNRCLKAVDSKKIAGIVNSVNDVTRTVRQNRGNIDSTLKNFSDMSAKLNESADKVDGVLTRAQSFLGSPGTKGAVDRISEAALSVRNSPTTSIRGSRTSPSGLSRFTNTGLREIRGARRRGEADGRGHRRRGAHRSDTIQVRSYSGRDPRCLNITAGNDGAKAGWIPRPIEIRRREHSCACAFGMRGRTRLRPFMISPPQRLPPARAVRAQFRIGQPTATADLDSDHILVRESQTLATLAGAQWSEPLACAFSRAAGRELSERGARALDRRAVGECELRNRPRHSLLRARHPDERNSCRHRRVDRLAWQREDHGEPDFQSLRIAVGSTDSANVAAAMDQAASTVMTDIVVFVARKL